MDIHQAHQMSLPALRSPIVTAIRCLHILLGPGGYTYPFRRRTESH